MEELLYLIPSNTDIFKVPLIMQYLLVPVIMVCAIGGTVGALKLIKKFFPNAGDTVDRTQEWIDRHSTAEAKKGIENDK